MKKIVQLNVKHIGALGGAIHALHKFFSEEQKSNGFNGYGISLPELDMSAAVTGLVINVYCPEDIDKLISSPSVIELLSSSDVTLGGVKSIPAPSECKYVAFIRDRKLERGSPKKAMSRMESSTSPDKKMWAKRNISRYLNEPLPQINIASTSNGFKFTLNIAAQEATNEQIQVASEQAMQFNTYGLSSYNTPIFLPVLAN